jgi:hypothetical protein
VRLFIQAASDVYRSLREALRRRHRRIGALADFYR